MTEKEAQVGHCMSRLVVAAVNSNLYAQQYPDKAAEGVETAEFYAKWLNDNSNQVELEITEDGDRRCVKTVTINGRNFVKNGAYVNQK